MKTFVTLFALVLVAAVAFAPAAARAQAPAAADTSVAAAPPAVHEAATPEAPPATPQTVSDVLSRALAVSGKSLAVIFFVMALFGGLIALLGRVYPGTEEEPS